MVGLPKDKRNDRGVAKFQDCTPLVLDLVDASDISMGQCAQAGTSAKADELNEAEDFGDDIEVDDGSESLEEFREFLFGSAFWEVANEG